MGSRATLVKKKPEGAHYLHGRSGLQAILRPPVDKPASLAWLGNKEVLLVATTTGSLVEVDPVMGTRTLCPLGGEVVRLCTDTAGRLFAGFRADGLWCSASPGGEGMQEGEHGFTQPLGLFFLGRYLVMFGEVEDRREVAIFADGTERLRRKIPNKCTVFPGSDGKLWFARSTVRGFECGPLGKRTRFSEDEPTNHVLVPSAQGVLGLTSHGGVIWSPENGSSESIGLLDIHTGALSADGQLVGVGTVGGVVGLVNMQSFESRKSPFLTKAHDTPIHSVAFAGRGRWLATGADRVQLWSWDAI